MDTTSKDTVFLEQIILLEKAFLGKVCSFKYTYNKHKDIFLDVFVNGNLTIVENCSNNMDNIIRNEILGLFFCWILHDYEKALEAFNKVINEKKNKLSLYYTGIYYKYIEKNYELSKHYFILAIEKNHNMSMIELALQYHHYEYKYGQAEHFYLMAADNNKHYSGSKYTGIYYEKIEKNYEKAIYYYLKSIEKGSHICYYCLGHLYDIIENNYTKATEYYFKGLDKQMQKCLKPLINVLKKNYNMNFDTLYPIVQKIVKHPKGPEYYKIFEKNVKNKLMEWKILNYIDTLNQHFINIKNTLKQHKNVGHFYDKYLRTIRYNIKDDCILCLEKDVLNFDIGCSHGVCYKCYKTNMKCHYNCENQILLLSY